MSTYVKVRKGKSKAGRKQGPRVMLKPPQLESNIVISHKFRFTATAGAAATNIDGLCLSGVAGAVGTFTNADVQPIAESFRIKKVSIWSPPAAQGGNATCAVEFKGGATGFIASKEFTDTSVSTSQPAYVSCRPPRGSAASLWQNPVTTNNILMSLTCGAGSIIDVDLDYILTDLFLSAVTPLAVATATLGRQYYLALDNGGGGGHNFVPVSLTTTF